MPFAALGFVNKAIRSGLRAGRMLLRSPLERLAKRLQNKAIGRGTGLITMTEESCYASFDANKLATSPDTISKLAHLGETWKTVPYRIRDENKFPYNLLRSEDLFEHRAFIDLAVQDEILAAISSYIGQLPRLYNLTLWWTPPNQTAERSQLYHYDHRDNRQAKVFINLNNVTKESGPLHFISAQDCLKVDAKVGYSQGRYTDEDVYSAVPESKVIATTGGPGSGFIVDTARCLHYGSRGNTLDRFVLMASYARVNSVKPGPGCRVLDPVRKRLAKELYNSDPVKSFVLDTSI